MIKWRRLLSFSSINVIDAARTKMKKIEFKVFKGMKRPRIKAQSVEEVLARRKK